MRVFPMYVGVILQGSHRRKLPLGIPHVCGGDPSNDQANHLTAIVFPMYVGVILTLSIFLKAVMCIPHVCGGDPLTACC